MAIPSQPSLPTLTADLLLVHAPAHFEFRNRSDIYFPYLSTSGDVPITPLYEYFPVGFKTLQRALGDRGHDVRILNLSTLLLRYPHLQFDTVLQALQVKLLGIDLHWMVHVQGSLEVAKRFKAVHPLVPVIFGGISSTYYANELVRYPFVDMVMRGYDTHEPMAALLSALGGRGSLDGVANLLWKDRDGSIVDNGFNYTPDSFACGIDWSTIPHKQVSTSLPILEVLSTQNAGCSYNCGWCGGSREAFRRVNGRKKAMARKPQAEVDYEFRTMSSIPNQEQYHFYSVGSYNETKDGLDHFLDQVADANFRSISYEQYHLTPEPVLKKMAAANRRTSITLSPESSNMRVATLSGRGVYTMEEMEDWIARALDLGIYQVDVWFFIGMPEQGPAEVFADVEYADHLLRRFPGKRVNPYLCPMIPFLDPASTFFEQPDSHGYRVFFRTAEEHRRGMTRASVINRINYETRWLSRSDLVKYGYAAMRRLTEVKAGYGIIPNGIAESIVRRIDDAVQFIDAVHGIDEIQDARARARELARVGPDILRRNQEILFSGVANQGYPVNREIGGRWFDEIGWDPAVLEPCPAPVAATV
jgi:clorobiocin biosynthesis protein CloN6